MLLFIFNSNLSAQLNLTGTVKDSLNIPLAHASVTLLNSTNKLSTFIQTDSTGYFSFKELKPGYYILKISVAEYQKFQTAFNLVKDTALGIFISHSSARLSEVLLTPKKTTIQNNLQELVYKVSNSITATGGDALTAISEMPGIKTGNGEISIVGKGVVSVMVDGHIIQLAGTDLVRYLKSISSNQISKIELIKNPSASYDAEGNAGIINIITKRSNKKGYSGNVQVSGLHWLHHPAVVYGTSNYWVASGSANINYNSATWSAYGSLNLAADHELEGFETDVFYPKQTWLQTDTGDYTYQNINMVAGIDKKLNDRITIGASYLGGWNVYDGSDYVNNPIYNLSAGLDSTLHTYATYHPVAISNSINLHSIILFDTAGKKITLNVDYFSYYRTDRSDFESNSFTPNGDLKPLSRTRYFDTNKQDIDIYTFKADADIPTPFADIRFGGKLSFINNYSNVFYYKKTEQNDLVYDDNLSNEFNYAENTQALYANLEKEKNKWKYQAGLRTEITQTKGYSYTLSQTTINNYVKFFPSILVSYQSGKDNLFAFTFGKRINRPTFWNLNPFKSLFTAYSYGVGNPYLQPEYNSNFELSHKLKNNLTSALFLNISNNGFTNVTIANNDTNLVYTIPLNFIKTYRYGISENYSFHVSPMLENNNQVSFYRVNAQSALPNIRNVNRYSLYIATNNTLYFNKEKTIGAALNFWYQFPEIDHIGVSDAYSKLDIGVTVLSLQKKLSITLNLNDAFRSSALAVTTNVNGIKEKFTNFQINRYLQLAVNYNFGNHSSNVERNTGNKDETERAL